MDNATKKKLRGKVIVLSKGPSRAVRREMIREYDRRIRQFHAQSPAQVRMSMELKGLIKPIKK